MARVMPTMKVLVLSVATCIVLLAVGVVGDGRILSSYDAPVEDFYPVTEGGNDVEVATPGTSSPRGDAVRELRVILQDRYLSHPLAVVVDIEQTSLERATTLWDAALENVHDPDVALTLLPYNASGLGPVFKTRSVSWFLQALHYLHADPQPDNGVAFYSILKATEQVGVDSAIVLFTARQAVDENLAQLAAHTLQQKRCKVYVFWCGPVSPRDGSQPGVETLFRELAVMTGGKFHAPFPDAPAVPSARPHEGGREDKSKEVTLAVRRGVVGKMEAALQVDSTVSVMHITIDGPVRRAVLQTPTGATIDLLSETALLRWTSAGIRVIAKTADLAELQVNTSALPPGTWRLSTTGVERQRRYNVTVTAASRLSFSAAIQPNNAEDKDGGNSRLRLTLIGVGDIADVSLVDENGKELNRLTYQRREGFAPGPNGRVTTDLDLPTDLQSTSPIYVKLSGQDHTGAEFTRLSPLERQFQVPVSGGLLPAVTIELAANSTLNVLPNYWAQLVFEVTNNRNVPVRYFFGAKDEKGFVRNIQPTQFVLGPLLTVNVVVTAIAPAMTPHGTIDTLTLIVQTVPMFNEAIRKSALITIGDRITDSERPKVWHTVKTNCEHFLSPNTCESSVWSTEITIEDRHSGLLRVTSVPRGIQFRTDFIAGTKSSITAYYSSTCCETRVDITATDVLGNYVKHYINGDNTFYGLEKGEIAAVVLGVILLLALILIIVLTVCICKNRRSRELPVRPRSTH